MIKKFVSGISTTMGINLSKVSLVDGQSLGCIDVQLLNMSSKGQVVSALIFQADIENLKNGVGCDSLEVRLRASLSRLQMLLDA
ncbi:MAG: hypothetical protein WC007_16180 [Pelobacteraceae bacterium]